MKLQFLSDKQMVTTAEILQFAISLDLDRINNGHQRRVGRVLRALGWENSSRKVSGKSQRVWTRTDSAEPFVESPSDF